MKGPVRFKQNLAANDANHANYWRDSRHWRLKFFREWWMVDQLYQHAIRIMEVKGSRAVAVGLGFLCHRNATIADLIEPLIDILRPADNEADVMQVLHFAG